MPVSHSISFKFCPLNLDEVFLEAYSKLVIELDTEIAKCEKRSSNWRD
jgi:hypothetical protein